MNQSVEQRERAEQRYYSAVVARIHVQQAPRIDAPAMHDSTCPYAQYSRLLTSCHGTTGHTTYIMGVGYIFVTPPNHDQSGIVLQYIGRELPINLTFAS